MKSLKKMFALVIAMVMVLGLALPAMAAEETPKANSDGTYWQGDTHYDTERTDSNDGTLTVAGVSNGDTVKFYKVLAYDQNADKTVENAAPATANGYDYAAAGWKLIAPFAASTITLQDFKDILTTGISSELAGKLAALVDATPDYTASATTQVSGDNYSAVAGSSAARVEPGLYVAIVEPANAGWIYNPIFVASDYYTTAGGDKSSTWTAIADLSYSDGAMAKKAPVTITKTAAEKAEATNETDGAKAVGVGDVITYTITTTIPEFADNYTNPLFVISDKLSDGLTYGGNSTLTVTPTLASGDTLTSDDYEISNPTGLAFKIAFKPASLLKLSAATLVTITYEATVTESAITNVNEEDNTVTLEYSHQPDVDEEGEGKKERDKTHHYTFTIDGKIFGDESYHATEVVKVGIDKNGNEITTERELSNTYKIGALQGAEFKLYTDANCTTEYNKGAYGEATRTTAGNKILSDVNGRLYINGSAQGVEGIYGLDAGTYYLKEELAPAGYIKQQAPVKIEIIPTYFDTYKFTEDGFTLDCDDVLKSYIVKINDVKTAEYVLTYPASDSDGVHSTDIATGVTGAGDAANTKGDIVIGNSGPITTDKSTSQDSDAYGKILNVQGVELPSTGGMGTTIFYIIGAVLVLAAGIVLVTRKRMSSN